MDNQIIANLDDDSFIDVVNSDFKPVRVNARGQNANYNNVHENKLSVGELASSIENYTRTPMFSGDIIVDNAHQNQPIDISLSGKLDKSETFELYCRYCRKVALARYYYQTPNCVDCHDFVMYKCFNCEKVFKDFQGARNHQRDVCEEQFFKKFRLEPKFEIQKESAREVIVLPSHQVNFPYQRYGLFYGNMNQFSGEHQYSKSVRAEKYKSTNTTSQCSRPSIKKEANEITLLELSNSEEQCLCPKCGETCREASEMNQCVSGKMYQCDYCTFASYHIINTMKHKMHEHMRPRSEESSMQSIQDSKETDRNVSFKDSEIYTKIAMFCSKCDHEYTKTERRTTRGKCQFCDESLIFRCRTCKKTYFNAGSIQNHLKYECNIQPKFECVYCDYKAKQKGNLMAHVKRKHTMERCMGCGKEFDNYVALKQHQMKNCENRVALQCSDCPFTCENRTALQNHSRTVHKSKYKCSRCGKLYKNFNSLQRHLVNPCEN